MAFSKKCCAPADKIGALTGRERVAAFQALAVGEGRSSGLVGDRVRMGLAPGGRRTVEVAVETLTVWANMEHMGKARNRRMNLDTKNICR